MKRGKWMICRVCQGEGSHVNPNIDSQGLSREDFEEAGPEFAEDYRSGVYNVACQTCQGTGKIERKAWAKRAKELRQAAEDRRLAAQEDGNWDAYNGAGDWRFGA